MIRERKHMWVIKKGTDSAGAPVRYIRCQKCKTLKLFTDPVKDPPRRALDMGPCAGRPTKVATPPQDLTVQITQIGAL